MDRRVRMMLELEDLTGKFNKLDDFMEGDVYDGLPIYEKDLLLDQFFAMLDYKLALTARLEL